MTPYYDYGGITIYHGDCREVLPSVSASVLITDPPYGINYASNQPSTVWREAIACDGDTSARDFVMSWAMDRPAAVFGTWRVRPFGNPRTILVWDKGPACGMGDLSLPWKGSWEEIYIYGDGWYGHRGEGVLKGHTVVTWASKGREHPNAKPVSLLVQLVGKAPCGVIVDPFMGSGPSLVAAKQLGRRAIGIEIEERYCEIAAKRLSQEVLPLEVSA